MKNLLQPETAEEIRRRLMLLRPDSVRQWGSMSVTQALAHCTCSVQMAMGIIRPKREPFPTNIVGSLYKPLFFRREIPFRRNSQTAPELLSAHSTACDFESERTKLLTTINSFITTAPPSRPQYSHAFFGRLTSQQWAALVYRNLDHHLRQFDV
ncbi:DUF1569 domain-containing protein [Granulicella sp. dw_53]|uniref:DUF1569 domain-containing protein n=1 Tax=Granulicella sp. dw_53 TaxID=2719792 RepID=UPI001BD1E581|nr:DUF1569 domain-containing protein [Granulicella sp. dw_53]